MCIRDRAGHCRDEASEASQHAGSESLNARWDQPDLSTIVSLAAGCAWPAYATRGRASAGVAYCVRAGGGPLAAPF
eukprot:2049923-Alexandrium_andersonii.AAC.1